MTPAVPGVFGLQGTLAVRCHQQVSRAGALVDRVLAVPQPAAQGRLADLVGGRHRQAAGEPDQPRRPLDAEVGLLAEEGSERAGVEVATGELERRHDLIPGDRVGDGVDGGCGHTGEAAQDPLDGGGREVLRVHAEPVRRTPGEPVEAVLVAVAEIAGPEVAVPQSVQARRGVLVVALEASRGTAGDDFADGLLRIEHHSAGIEPRRRADLAEGADDLHREPSAVAAGTAPRCVASRPAYPEPLASRICGTPWPTPSRRSP